MTTKPNPPRRHHQEIELPAPRGRTAFLVLSAFAFSLLLTGWLGAKEEEVLVARLAASSKAIVATHSGRLSEIVCPEGETIQAGGELVHLDDESLRNQITAAENEVALCSDAWKQSLAKADVDLTWRLRVVDAEILQTRLKMTELLQQQFDFQIQQQAWKDRLGNYGTVARQTAPDEVFRNASLSRRLPGENELEAMIQHEATRNAADVAKVKLQLCEKRLGTLKSLKVELPARIHKAFGADATKARLNAAKTKLAALKSRQKLRTVVSAKFGTVGKYRGQIGDQVKAGDVLVEVIDESQRFLVVDVPANRLTQLMQTEIIHLRFPGGKKFEGKVGERLAQQPRGDGETIAVRIEPAGRLWPEIPLGSAVEVVLKPGG